MQIVMLRSNGIEEGSVRICTLNAEDEVEVSTCEIALNWKRNRDLGPARP